MHGFSRLSRPKRTQFVRLSEADEFRCSPRKPRALQGKKLPHALSKIRCVAPLAPETTS